MVVMISHMIYYAGIVALVAMLVAITYAGYNIRKIKIQQSAINNKLQRLLLKIPEAVIMNAQAISNLNALLPNQHGIPLSDLWSAMPDFLHHVARHCLLHRPNNIVECGSGVSTVVLALCLRRIGSGHIYSLEHDPEYAVRTRNMLKEYGLEDIATVIDAALVDTIVNNESWIWYSLDNLPDAVVIDLLVIDGPPTPMGALMRYSAGPMLFPRLSPRAVVFLDDANREDEKSCFTPMERGISQFRCQIFSFYERMRNAHPHISA